MARCKHQVAAFIDHRPKTLCWFAPQKKNKSNFVLKKAEQQVGRSRSPTPIQHEPEVSRFHRQNRIEEQYTRCSPIGKIASRAAYSIGRSHYFENVFKEGGSFSPAGTEKANPQALPGV